MIKAIESNLYRIEDVSGFYNGEKMIDIKIKYTDASICVPTEELDELLALLDKFKTINKQFEKEECVCQK